MCPATSMNKNPITRITNALAKAVNENAYLPKHVIVLLDEIFVNFAAPYAERMTRWLLTLENDIGKNDQLPERARPFRPPTMLIIKPVAKPSWIQDEKAYTKKKCTIKRYLREQIKFSKYMASLNIDTILPKSANLFNLKGNLNGQGHAEFWYFIDQTIDLVDNPKPTPILNSSNKDVNEQDVTEK